MIDLKEPGAFEDAELAMSTMLTRLLNPVIDYPQHCSAAIVRCDEVTTFVVKIHSEDLERLAREDAKVAKSLKLLAGAVGFKAQRRFSVTFRKRSRSAEASTAGLPEIIRT